MRLRKAGQNLVTDYPAHHTSAKLYSHWRVTFVNHQDLWIEAILNKPFLTVVIPLTYEIPLITAIMVSTSYLPNSHHWSCTTFVPDIVSFFHDHLSWCILS